MEKNENLTDDGLGQEMAELNDYELISKVKNASYTTPDFQIALKEMFLRFECYADRSKEIRMPEGCGRHPLDMD